MKKEDKNFKIFKKEYYDGYGILNNTHFFIKEKKYFLGIPYWKTIKRDLSYLDSWKEIIRFNSEKEAIKFIREILCNNSPREKDVISEIEKFNCSDLR